MFVSEVPLTLTMIFVAMLALAFMTSGDVAVGRRAN